MSLLKNRQGPKPFLLAIVISLCFRTLAGAIDVPPRLFLSDAHFSLVFPDHWTLQPKFPDGPLFSKETQEGQPATITYAASGEIFDNRLTSDLPKEKLQELARTELDTHQTGFKGIGERDLLIAGHNVYEILWESIVDGQLLDHQSDYFFVDNRVFALSLHARPRSFRWLTQDFGNWLGSLTVLSRRDKGALSQPARGGIWIHLAGGIKISIPDHWLIAVADDRSLGATRAAGGSLHTEFTVSLDNSQVDSSAKPNHAFKKEARNAVLKKNYRIIEEIDAPFHGFPAFSVHYDGAQTPDRFVEGMDIWVFTPKARWLINTEGELGLYNSMKDDYDQILHLVTFIP